MRPQPHENGRSIQSGFSPGPPQTLRANRRQSFPRSAHVQPLEHVLQLIARDRGLACSSSLLRRQLHVMPHRRQSPPCFAKSALALGIQHVVAPCPPSAHRCSRLKPRPYQAPRFQPFQCRVNSAGGDIALQSSLHATQHRASVGFLAQSEDREQHRLFKCPEQLTAAHIVDITRQCVTNFAAKRPLGSVRRDRGENPQSPTPTISPPFLRLHQQNE